MIRNIIICLMCVLSLAGCKIENDIPYPVLEGNIEAFEVEGQQNLLSATMRRL